MSVSWTLHEGRSVSIVIMACFNREMFAVPSGSKARAEKKEERESEREERKKYYRRFELMCFSFPRGSKSPRRAKSILKWIKSPPETLESPNYHVQLSKRFWISIKISLFSLTHCVSFIPKRFCRRQTHEWQPKSTMNAMQPSHVELAPCIQIVSEGKSFLNLFAIRKPRRSSRVHCTKYPLCICFCVRKRFSKVYRSAEDDFSACLPALIHSCLPRDYKFANWNWSARFFRRFHGKLVNLLQSGGCGRSASLNTKCTRF